jgi:dihydropyrimidine dehydrogenase (NAD+) subunit PreA
VACNDTAHQCIDLIAKDGSVVAPYGHDERVNGRLDAVETRPRVQVREVDCVGCRLCFNVCPVEGCIAMVEEPSGRAAVTWGQITQREPAVTEDWNAMERYRAKMGIEIH